MDSIQLEYKGKTYELKPKKCTLKLRDEMRALRIQNMREAKALDSANAKKLKDQNDSDEALADTFTAVDKFNIDYLIKHVQLVGELVTDDKKIIKLFNSDPSSDEGFWAEQDYIGLNNFQDSFRAMARV